MTIDLPFTLPLIDAATIDAVTRVLESGWLSTGPKSRAFEEQLSGLCGGRPVRAVNSATAAMELALRMWGLAPGDEVVTTPLTWVATANVVLSVGARPTFADIDPATRNIDLDALEAAITPRTRGVTVVDLAGLPVDRDRLYAIARKHDLRVLEDAAQSLGANWGGTPIGQRAGGGDGYVSFSFHANKNATTGEGGALVLNTDAEAETIERMRVQGVKRLPAGEMDVEYLGYKCNLTDIAAVIGLGQLQRLEEFTARRQQLARLYFEHWRAPGELPLADFKQSNWHMFQPVIPFARLGTTRAAFIDAMAARGIGVGVHYPALHLFTLYKNLGWREGQFPHAERVGRETVTLPLFPAMRDADVLRVCSAAADILGPRSS